MLIHQNAKRETIEWARILVFGIWLFIASVRFSPADILSLPFSAYEPIGALRVMPDAVSMILFSPAILYLIKILAIISIVCVLLKIKLKITTACSVILILIEHSIMKGYGHISHGELVVLYASFIITLFYLNEDKLFAAVKDDSISIYSFPVIFILFILCFSYSLTGIARLVFGGMPLFTSESIVHWLIKNSNRAGFISWHLDEFMVLNGWIISLFKLGFPIVTLFEIFSPLSLVNKFFRMAFIVVMVGFHLFSWIFLGILFWENLCLFVLFFDLSKLKPRRKSNVGKVLAWN